MEKKCVICGTALEATAIDIICRNPDCEKRLQRCLHEQQIELLKDILDALQSIRANI
jgi:hypothetical protein